MNRPAKGSLPLECLAHWVETQGDRDYLIQPVGDEVKHFTWKETDEQARRFAAYLQTLDLPPKSQIGLVSANCAWWIIADLGIWMAGHVSVPLYPTLNEDTVEHILTHSESRLLVVGKLSDWKMMKAGVPEGMKTVALPLHPDDDFDATWDDVQKHEPLQEVAKREPDEMATIVYTSGSTGLPKGVMLSFKALQASPQNAMEIVEIFPTDRVLSYLPLAHVYERAVVEQTSLFNGMYVYFNDTLETFPQDLKRARPTIFASVPRLWVKFKSAVESKMSPAKQKFLFMIPGVSGVVKKKILAQLGLDEVRYAITGSAPLPQSVIDWYRSLGLELLEGYGMSENFGYSHATRPGQAKQGYVGHVAPGAEHKIAENGEILVKSPCNMLGFFKQPDKTREELDEEGWLHTGDMGEIDSEGRLKITGRVKELFKTSKGKYVAPAPIENKLVNHPAIEAVCVAGANQGQPFALVMLSEEYADAKNDAAKRDKLEQEFNELKDKVNAALDKHENLKFMVIVSDQWTIDNGFLTPTMKIKRNVVEDAYSDKVDGWYASDKPVIWD